MNIVYRSKLASEIAMLANSRGSKVQKDKKMTAPDGETGLKIVALSGETSIVQKRPRV